MLLWCFGMTIFLLLASGQDFSQENQIQYFAKPGMQTSMLYKRNGSPPPWPNGNRVRVLPKVDTEGKMVPPSLYEHIPAKESSPTSKGASRKRFDLGWTVLNMHGENLKEIMKIKGMEMVKVEPLSTNHCLVVDERIPRNWFLTYPYTSLPARRALRLERPNSFHTEPKVEALIGTAWKLVEREDPDGLLDRFLPGDEIQFEDMDLSCHSDKESSKEVKRVWEWTHSYGLSIYDVQKDVSTGIVGRIILNEDDFSFTVNGKIKTNSDGGGSHHRYDGITKARFRLIQP